MILDSEEIYKERGKKHSSLKNFYDSRTIQIEVSRMKKRGLEVEEIAIELGLSNDEVNKIIKGKSWR
jgi:transcriptional regulator